MAIVPSTASKDTIPALERIFANHGIPEVLKTDSGPPSQGHAFQSFAKEKDLAHGNITSLWPEANGHVEGFMKNLLYPPPPPPSTGKSPYHLCMNRTVRIKLPTIMETTPDTEAMQKDEDSKVKMKAYADQKRHVKPHNLNAEDITLMKQRRLNKASPHFEPAPYTILDVEGNISEEFNPSDECNSIYTSQTH